MSRILLSGLLPNKIYGVRLRALGSSAFSDWTNIHTLQTIKDTILPARPINATWVVVDDSFHGEWDAVTTNVNGDTIPITRYEIELVGSGLTRIDLAQPSTGNGKVTYDLSYSKNFSLFGTPQPTLTFRVRAVDNKEQKSDWSIPTLSASNPAPAAPTAAVVTPGVDSIDVSWTPPADTDLIGYNVYVGASAGFTPSSANKAGFINGTRFTYTSTTYTTQYFKIRAVDEFLQESTDLNASGTPNSPFVVDTTPPATPTGLAATITNNTNGIGATASVSWTMTSPPSDLAGFYVRYRKVGDTVYQSEAYDKSARTGVILLNNAFTNYEFQIAAYDWSANISAYSSTVTATSPANPVPSNVTGLTGTAGKDSITYSWTPVSDLDIKNYEVTFSTSATFASGNSTFLTGTSTALTVGGLTNGTTYYARVRAVDTAGQTSAAWSSTNTSTTGTSAVSDGSAPGSSPTPTVMGGLSYLYVTWPATTNNDPVTYDVHLSTTSGFTPSTGTKVTETSATTVVIDNLPGTSTALSYGTTYYIKIVARDRDGSAAAGTQGSGQISKVASGDVTSIGADLIVPGTGFANALVVASGGSIQSSNYSSGSAGYKISTTGIEMNDSGSTIKADAIKAGTLGGSGGSGVINIAAGTSLIFNGGYMKSNTYTGTTQATNPSGAGFYLGNDGIRIDQGMVSAAALTTGTVTAGTITIGTGGSLAGPGFTLNSSGLNVTSGTISAAALTLQNGTNIVPPEYADFEGNTTFYTSAFVSNAMTATIDTTNKYFNSQALKWTTTAGGSSLYFSPSTTNYNINVNPSATYIISFYAMVPSGGASTNLVFGMHYPTASGDAHTDGSAATIPANSTWARYSTTVTLPSTVQNKAVLFAYISNGLTSGTIYIDGIQVEEKIAGSNTPSTWKPPGSTVINGSIIRTGQIISSQVARVMKTTPIYAVNGTTVTGYTAPIEIDDPNGTPAFNINPSGAAEFDRLSVRGSVTVGDPSPASVTTPFNVLVNTTSGSATVQSFPNTWTQADVGISVSASFFPAGTTVASVADDSHATMSAAATVTGGAQTLTINRISKLTSTIASANYVSGSTGWMIRSDGYGEFRNLASNSINGTVIVSNSITATQIAANTITAAQIAADTITATQIAANAITTSELAANAVTAGKISAGAVTAGTIDVGAVQANNIQAGAITAEKVSVGGWSNQNMVPNGTIEDGLLLWILGDVSGQDNNGTLTIDTTYRSSGNQSLLLHKATSGTGNVVARQNYYMPVTGGQIYYTSVMAAAPPSASYGSGYYFRIYWYDYNKNYITFSGVSENFGLSGSTGFNKIEGKVTAPAGANYAQISFYITNLDQWVNLDDFVFGRAVTGTVVVDGSITAQSLSATAIDGKTITGATMTAGTLTGNTIQTSTSIPRIVISSSYGWDRIAFFNNNPAANPGMIFATNTGSVPGINIWSATDGYYSSTGILAVNGGGGGGLPQMTFNGDGTISGSLNVNTYLINAGAPTTTTTANCFLRSDGVFFHGGTSLTSAKHDVQELQIDVIKGVLGLTPTHWIDKYEYDENDGDTSKLKRIPGLMVEDVLEHAPEFVTYDYLTDDPAGVAYDRIGVALIPLVKELYERIEALEAKLEQGS